MNRDVGPVTAYADAVLGGYDGTRAQFRTLLANLPHGVFFATYNSTSYSDISAAFSSGLYPIAVKSGTYYPLIDASNGFLFGVLGSNNSPVKCLKCSSGNFWSELSVMMDSYYVAYENPASVGVRDVRSALDELYTAIGSPAPGVFYATYNSTSYADIKAAFDAGMFVVVKGDVTANGENYYLPEHNEKRLQATFFRFVCPKANGVISYLTVSQNDSWARTSVDPAFAFYATYGETTYDEVEAALTAEKIVFAVDDDLVLPYVGDLGGGFLFSGVTTDTARTWTLSDHDVWSHYETDIPRNASELSYNNSSSGLSAYNVQEAIDELEARIATLERGV